MVRWVLTLYLLPVLVIVTAAHLAAMLICGAVRLVEIVRPNHLLLGRGGRLAKPSIVVLGPGAPARER